MKNTYWIKVIGLVVVFLTLNCVAHAQNEIPDSTNWKLAKISKKGADWQIYKAKVPGSKLYQFKIIGKVNCSIEKAQSTIMEMIVDPNTRITKKGKSLGWVKVLERSENEMIVYDFMKGPFLVKDRDVVVKYTLFKDSVENVMGIEWCQVDYKGYEATDSIVRQPIVTGSWSFKKIDSTNCIATERFQFHPGGTPPAWLVNMVAKSSIPIELEHLRKTIKKDNLGAFDKEWRNLQSSISNSKPLIIGD